MTTFKDDFAKKRRSLSKQYLNETTADIFFICRQGDQKERVPAHKFVLFTNSDVFDRMFHGSLPEGNEIKIPDASPNGFRTFLRYFYFFSDEYTLDIDVVGEVMYLSKKYNIDEYFDACCTFLKKKQEKETAKHILVGYELAIAYELRDLIGFFEGRIADKNEKVFDSEYIRTISHDLLKCIVKISSQFSYTKRMFDACMVWAEESCIQANIDPNVFQNRRKQLGDCFEHIEFGVMERDELVRFVMKFGDLFTPQELQRFIIMIAAKCPTPFNEDTIIRYKVGKTSMFNTELQENSTEELHYNPRRKILLGGITMAPLLHSYNSTNLQCSGILSILKVSTDKQTSDDILLLRKIFEIEAVKSSSTDPKASHVLMFTEAVIVEPHSNYSIQLTFRFPGNFQPYHKHTISSADEFPFHILPETNSKIISELLYSRLT